MLFFILNFTDVQKENKVKVFTRLNVSNVHGGSNILIFISI